jgi:hypothetical protein
MFFTTSSSGEKVLHSGNLLNLLWVPGLLQPLDFLCTRSLPVKLALTRFMRVSVEKLLSLSILFFAKAGLPGPEAELNRHCLLEETACEPGAPVLWRG